MKNTKLVFTVVSLMVHIGVAFGFLVVGIKEPTIWIAWFSGLNATLGI